MSVPNLFRVRQAEIPWKLHPNETVAEANRRETVTEGQHTWKLPSVRCPVCNMVWGSMNLVYPWLDISSLKPKRLYKANTLCVMSPDGLKPSVDFVRRMLPPGLPVEPGTSLGPFNGRLYGPLTDFFFNRKMKLIRMPVYEKLFSKNALSITTTPTQVLDRKRQQVDYLELNLVPRARLAVPKVDRPGSVVCAACGFDSREVPETLVIKSSSIPSDEEIFQLFDAPGIKLAKPIFVETVRTLGLSGLEFIPVEVVD